MLEHDLHVADDLIDAADKSIRGCMTPPGAALQQPVIGGSPTVSSDRRLV